MAEKFPLVVAIDLGTTYSGYAYSFQSDYERDPQHIYGYNWQTSSIGSNFTKTSTSVLFESDGTFHSFGSEAEIKYIELADKGEEKGWQLFREFKSKLYESEHLDDHFELEDVQGNPMSAMKVFSTAIKYLKGHFEKSVDSITSSDVKWVITVPSIWSDASKHFMRKAAVKAGIKSDHLLIALEPEVASIYCRQELEKTAYNDSFGVGSKYLVIDAGGEMIGSTVHNINDTGCLKEVHRATGGEWGGTKVDEKFLEFLSDFVGHEVFKMFSEEQSADRLVLLGKFEEKKREVKPEEDKDIYIPIPKSLDECCRVKLGKPLAEIVKEKNLQDVELIAGKLKIPSQRIKNMFQDPINRIVEHIDITLSDMGSVGVNFILMVGGFSESPMLEDAVSRYFRPKQLPTLKPLDAELSILKGAVLFGQNPLAITSRISRYTYGIETNVTFEDRKHDPSKKRRTSSGDYICIQIFEIHVRKNQSVDLDNPQTIGRYNVTEPDQKCIEIPIFRSTSENPMYVTERDSKRIGMISVEIPDSAGELGRPIDVQMMFGKTELEVEATDVFTGEKLAVEIKYGE